MFDFFRKLIERDNSLFRYFINKGCEFHRQPEIRGLRSQFPRQDDAIRCERHSLPVTHCARLAEREGCFACFVMSFGSRTGAAYESHAYSDANGRVRCSSEPDKSKRTRVNRSWRSGSPSPRATLGFELGILVENVRIWSESGSRISIGSPKRPKTNKPPAGFSRLRDLMLR
jgi:hypothetical protein